MLVNNETYIHLVRETIEKYLTPRFNIDFSKYSYHNLLDCFSSLKSFNDNTNLHIIYPDLSILNEFFNIDSFIPIFLKILSDSETHSFSNLKVDDYYITINKPDTICQIKDVNSDLIKIQERNRHFSITKVPHFKMHNEYLKLNHNNETVDNFINLRNGEGARRIINARNRFNKIKSFIQTQESQHFTTTTKIGIVCSITDINKLKDLNCVISKIKRTDGFAAELTVDESILSTLIFHATNFHDLTYYASAKFINFDALFFIGDKYYYKTYQDILRYCRINSQRIHCYFVGTRLLREYENFKFKKIEHTYIEYRRLKGWQENNIKVVKLEQTELDRMMKEFSNKINSICEDKPEIKGIGKLFKYLKYIYSEFYLYNSSIAEKRLHSLFQKFKDEAKEILEDEYYVYDFNYEPDYKELLCSFEKIILFLLNSNPKSDYLLVSDIKNLVVTNARAEILRKEHIDDEANKKKKKVTIEELNIIFNKQESTQSKLIISTFDEINNNDPNLIYNIPSITSEQFEFSNDRLLKYIIKLNSFFKIICYRDEYLIANRLLEKIFRDDALKINSKTRVEWLNIKTEEINLNPGVDLDDYISQIIESEDFICHHQEEYKVIFDTNETIKERGNRKVIVVNNSQSLVMIRDLQPGDEIRIFDNSNPELFFEIVNCFSEDSFFKEILNYSKIWKQSLQTYIKRNAMTHSFYEIFLSLKELGLSVQMNALNNWLDVDSLIKFPKKKKDLAIIAKFLNDSLLNEKLKEIIAAKEKYNGTLVKFGVELSEEVNNFIVTKQKGQILDVLTDEEIKKVIEEGAPIRKVKSINKIGD